MKANLAAGKVALSASRPYLNHILWRMPFFESPIGTLAVDEKGRCYYDPQYVDSLTVDECAGVLYHEIHHLLREHAARLKGLGKTQMERNIAADLEINDDIMEEGIALPKGIIHPKLFGLPTKKTVEWYIENRPHENEKPNKKPNEEAQDKDKTEGGNGNERGDSQGDSRTSTKNDSPSKEMPAGGSCGSVAHGVPQSYERKDEEGAISPQEMDTIKVKIAMSIQSAPPGTVPGNLVRWAEEIHPTKVDWRMLLRRSARSALRQVSGKVDYTYRRISRRSPRNVILPAMLQFAPKVSLIIDTSGSMGNEQVGQALAEVKGIIREIGEVEYLSVDAEVHVKGKANKVKDVKLSGGGGTDMRKGFEQVSKDSNLIVVVTDGMTPWPGEKPRQDTVVCLVGGDGAGIPSWAKVVDARN